MQPSIERQIKLSQLSQTLFLKYGQKPVASAAVEGEESVRLLTASDNAIDVLTWETLKLNLKMSNEPRKHQKLVISLIHDLHETMVQELIENNKNTDNASSLETYLAELQSPKPKASKKKYLLFSLLTAAGFLFAACEGIDGIIAVLGLVSAPLLVLIVAGALFAFLSVVVFIAFNFKQMSDNLGLDLFQSASLLDEHVETIKELNLLREFINKEKNSAKMDKDRLEFYKDVLSHVQALKGQSLIIIKAGIDAKSPSWFLIAFKYALSATVGILFFGSGFFAGQTVALLLLGLCVASVTPAFLPVMLFSVVVGLSSLAVYWFVERKGLDKLIDNIQDRDEEKLAKWARKLKNLNVDTSLKDVDRLLKDVDVAIAMSPNKYVSV
jgi:hypothetical protein